MKCVVCDANLDGVKNHKCPPRIEGAWQAAQTRANNEDWGIYEVRQARESVRLYTGLALMGES